MTPIERVLQVLIHDMRTPVGVAQGYLRLLREERLRESEDRVRAITQAQQALDVVSHLCADAALFVEDHHDRPCTLVSARKLVSRVREHLEREPVEVSAPEWTVDRPVTVPVDADAFVDAISRVLFACPPDTADRRRSVVIGTSETELWFRSGCDHQDLFGDEFDPWRHRGFSLPLAVRAIAGVGGRVWTAGGGRSGTGVALPFEVTL